jgi:hypothetical protein
MKKLFAILLAVTLLTSCAQSKVLTIQGQPTVVKPYGWANAKVRKNENVIYEVNAGNIVWSILGVQTVALPVWLTGWQLFEPVDVKPEQK